MLSRHCHRHDILPARIVIVPAANTRDIPVGDVISHGPRRAGTKRRLRNAVAAVSSCAAGSSAGYALGGPVLAAVGFIAVTLLGAILAIALSAMLGSRDRRSPFERLMLLICAITGRCPRDYLPTSPAQEQPSVGTEQTAVTVTAALPQPDDVTQE